MIDTAEVRRGIARALKMRMERTLLALFALLAVLAAGAYGFYVSVVPILLISMTLVAAGSAGALAIAAGKLGRWVEIDDEPKAQHTRVTAVG